MTPTREQLIEDIAGKLWRDLCEGEGQHSEALDKSLIRKHMDRLAACLAAPPPGEVVERNYAQDLRDAGILPGPCHAAPPPEPQAMPPVEPGIKALHDDILARFASEITPRLNAPTKEDVLLLMGHVNEAVAAHLATTSQPEPWCETFVPMTHFGQPTGDDACNDCGLPAARHPVATQEYERGYLDACDDHLAEDAGKVNVTLGTAGSNLNVLWFKDSNGTVWTREPRR